MGEKRRAGKKDRKDGRRNVHPYTTRQLQIFFIFAITVMVTIGHVYSYRFFNKLYIFKLQNVANQSIKGIFHSYLTASRHINYII